MLIGLHLNRWLMNLGMKELEMRDRRAERDREPIRSASVGLNCFRALTWETCFQPVSLKL